MNKVYKYYEQFEKKLPFRDYDYVMVTQSDHAIISQELDGGISAYNNFDSIMENVCLDVHYNTPTEYCIYLYSLKNVLTTDNHYIVGISLIEEALLMKMPDCKEHLIYVDKIEINLDLLKLTIYLDDHIHEHSIVGNDELDIFNAESEKKLGYYKNSEFALMDDIRGTHKDRSTVLMLSRVFQNHHLLVYGDFESFLFFSVKQEVQIIHADVSKIKDMESIYLILLDTIARQNKLTQIKSLTDTFPILGKKVYEIPTFKKKYIEPFMKKKIKIQVSEDSLDEYTVQNNVFVGSTVLFDSTYEFKEGSTVIGQGDVLKIDYFSPSCIKYHKNCELTVVTGIQEIISNLFMQTTLYIKTNFKEERLEKVVEMADLLALYLIYKVTSKQKSKTKKTRIVLDELNNIAEYLKEFISGLSVYDDTAVLDQDENKFAEMLSKIDKMLYNSMHIGLMEEFKDIWKNIVNRLVDCINDKNLEKSSLFESVWVLSSRIMGWINENTEDVLVNSEKIVEMICTSKCMLLFLLDKSEQTTRIGHMFSFLNKKTRKFLAWHSLIENELKLLFEKNNHFYKCNQTILENIHGLISINQDSELDWLLKSNFGQIKQDIGHFAQKWTKYNEFLKMLIIKDKSLMKEYNGTFFTPEFYNYLLEVSEEEIGLKLEINEENNLELLLEAPIGWKLTNKNKPKQEWDRLVLDAYSEYLSTYETEYYNELMECEKDIDMYMSYVSHLLFQLQKSTIDHRHIKKDYSFLAMLVALLQIYKLNEVSAEKIMSLVRKELLVQSKRLSFNAKHTMENSTEDVFIGNEYFMHIEIRNIIVDARKVLSEIVDVQHKFSLFVFLEVLNDLAQKTIDTEIPCNLGLLIMKNSMDVLGFYAKNEDNIGKKIMDHWNQFEVSNSKLELKNANFGNALFSDNNNVNILFNLYN